MYFPTSPIGAVKDPFNEKDIFHVPSCQLKEIKSSEQFADTNSIKFRSLELNRTPITSPSFHAEPNDLKSKGRYCFDVVSASSTGDGNSHELHLLGL